MALTITHAGAGPGKARTAPMFGFSSRTMACWTGTVDFDNSYPSGGEAFDLTTSGQDIFRSINTVIIEPKSGYTFEYDYANKKIKAFQPAGIRTAAISVNPASLATDAIANTAVTVTGAATTDDVIAIPPDAFEAGLVVQKAWVSATDTVQVRISNTSAGTVDAAAANWRFILIPQSRVAVQVPDATDLSALTGVRVIAFGTK